MTRRVLAASLGALLLAGCVSHPVGPARTFGKYEGKAVTTARAALSAVETGRLAAHAGTTGNGFGPYLSEVVSGAEDQAEKVDGTFASIQPPGARADALRAQMRTILSDAVDHLSGLRVAVRRGRLGSLDEVAAPLADDARRLGEFIDGHR